MYDNRSSDDARVRAGKKHAHGRSAWVREMSPEERHGSGLPPFGGRRGRRGRGFPPSGPMGSFFGRGPRAGRGDVRAAILALLAESSMHGYQIIRELNERSGGVWSPSPGSVYPTLQHLEEEELVQGADADGKRVFTITDAGRAVLADRDAGRAAPWHEVGADVDAGLIDLKDAIGQVAVAVRQVVHTGTDRQIRTARAVLDDARRSLYRILAEDPTDQDDTSASPDL